MELKVRSVPGMLAIFRPRSAEKIDFDIDLRELQGQDGVDTLCGFFGESGRKPGKPVLGFDPALDRVALPADPLAR